MNDERAHSEHKPAQSNAVVIVWIALGLGLLTFCGGKTDDGQSSGGASGGGFSGEGGLGNDGYAGHTAQCLADPKACPNYGGQGGFSGDGFAGHTSGCMACDQGTCNYLCPHGAGGQGGLSGQTGFGGHTSSCVGRVVDGAVIAGMCGGICAPCPIEAGTDAHLVADAVAEARSAEAAVMTMNAANVIGLPSCYVLSGYEPDPCLPIDDSLLPWLSNVPTSCQSHVTAGPFQGVDNQQGRTCCYSVACE